MTVESNYVIATDTVCFSDWLKRPMPVFNQLEAKPIAPCTHDYSCTLSESPQVIARNCD